MHCFGSAAADEMPLAGLEIPSDSAIRLLVIVTDDDFLETGQRIWCDVSLQEAVDSCREQRRATYLKTEAIRAGSPALLRGGRSIAGGPRRVICFVCNAQRQILSFCVGVPSTRQLLTLSEDADELAVSLTLSETAGLDTQPDKAAENATRLANMVRDRATQRVTRHYRPLLAKIDPSLNIEASANLIADALASDIKERFLFDSPIESERWISAQQHAEARRYWCDTMLIGIVGKNIDEIWPQLAASVWGAAPWHRSEKVQHFATDCSETLQQKSLVCELDLTKSYVHAESIVGLVQKRLDAPETKREAAIATALEKAQAKGCDLCELAVLLRELKQPPIKLRSPKTQTIRWVIMDKPDSEPKLIPQGAENRLIDVLTSLKP